MNMHEHEARVIKQSYLYLNKSKKLYSFTFYSYGIFYITSSTSSYTNSYFPFFLAMVFKVSNNLSYLRVKQYLGLSAI